MTGDGFYDSVRSVVRTPYSCRWAMPRKAGKRSKSMMYLFVVMSFLASLPIVLVVTRAISMSRVPRGCTPQGFGLGPVFETLVGVFTVFFVIIGYHVVLRGQGAEGVFLTLFGGGGSLIWICIVLYACHPDTEKAQEFPSLKGWEVCFGRAVWVEEWRWRGKSVFPELLQALGLVHFVDGLEVLHFRGDCDNGGKIKVKLVVVPSSTGVAPVEFWQAVAMVIESWTEKVRTQAKGATSPQDISLKMEWFHCLKLHPDTRIAYTPPPELWQPITV